MPVEKSISHLAPMQKVGALLRSGEYFRLLHLAVKNMAPAALFQINRHYYYHCPDTAGRYRALTRTSVREATHADLDLLLACHGDRRDFSRRFQEGNRCFIALIDGICAATLWFKTADRFRSISGYTFTPERTGTLLYDAYTLPAYRAKGLYIALLQAIYHDLPDLASKDLYGEIHYENTQSLALFDRLKCPIIQRVVTVSILGIRIFFVKHFAHPARPRA